MTTAAGTALPAELVIGVHSKGVNETRVLGFIPRILVLTTLPHSRPTTRRFERVNGRYSLCLEARRSIGLPYGVYPRLILIYLASQAVCTKSPKINLGRTPNDLARKLGLAPISGPRGTSKRLHNQLHSLVSTRFRWQYSKDFRTQESGHGLITPSDSALELLKACFQRRSPTWNPELVLSRQFFQEITRSAVPVDLRAIELLKRSPLAIDIYIWLTYRMSYLRRPASLPFFSSRPSSTPQVGSGQFWAARFRSIQGPQGATTGPHELVGRLLAPYGVEPRDVVAETRE